MFTRYEFIKTIQIHVTEKANPEPEPPRNISPTARASATPTSGTAPLRVSFSSSGSSDPDGRIVYYRWDFKDGSTSSIANPSHTFDSLGTYTVTLRITDDDGATNTDSATITITDKTIELPNRPPDRPDAPKPREGESTFTVKVDENWFCDVIGVDPDGDRISKFTFDFGDGPSAGVSINYASPASFVGWHKWTKIGTYQVRVRVTDQHGAESEWSAPCVVEVIGHVEQKSAKIEFTVSPNEIRWGETAIIKLTIKEINGMGAKWTKTNIEVYSEDGAIILDEELEPNERLDASGTISVDFPIDKRFWDGPEPPGTKYIWKLIFIDDSGNKIDVQAQLDITK